MTPNFATPDVPTQPRHRGTVPFVTAVACVLVTIVVTWFVSGLKRPHYREADHAVGPFHVPLVLEWVVAGLVLAFTAWAIVVRTRDRRRGSADVARNAVLWLCFAAVAAVQTWRVNTADVIGANIGGGIALFFIPVLIDGFALAAVFAHRRTVGHATRQVLPPLAAMLLGPALFGLAICFT